MSVCDSVELYCIYYKRVVCFCNELARIEYRYLLTVNQLDESKLSMKNILTIFPISVVCFIPILGVAQTVHTEIFVTLLEAPNESDFEVGDIHKGKVSYDSSLLVGEGEEEISVAGIQSLTFDFNGVTYNETYDVATGFPKLYFVDSELVGIDYWNNVGVEGGGDRSFFSFHSDQSFNYSPNGVSEFSGIYTLSAVPETQSSLLLGIGSGALIMRRQRS